MIITHVFSFGLLVLSFLQFTPTLEKGRIRPNTEYKDFKIPLKDGTWIRLEVILQNKHNDSLYSDETLQLIKKGYEILQKEGNPSSLTFALNQAYLSLAGKPIKKGNVNTLYFPTKYQLITEAIYQRIPFVLIILLLYITAAFTGNLLCFLAFSSHTLLLCVRMFILSRPPVTNMTETVLFAAWVIMLCGLLYYWRYKRKFFLKTASALAALFLCFVLFFGMDRGLENVQPVLNSRFWLTCHVLMVVASFGVFALSALLGHFFLFSPTKKQAEYLLQTLYVGTLLLIPGTILGGIWAAQSWGRFWDWDPKESWAFISSGVYLLTIHAYRYHKIGPFGLAVGSILGFMAISFTWYGVNYILGTGLHSYGFGTGGVGWYLAYLGTELFFLLFFLARRFVLYKKKASSNTNPKK